MLTIEPTRKEATEVAQLAESLAASCRTADEPELISDLKGAAGDLPQALREPLLAYMDAPDSAVAVVRNHCIDDQAFGPTPLSWDADSIANGTLQYELVTLLYGSLMGDVFAWATQQDGRFVNDVLPVPTLANAQVGGSSSTELAWHTEDAFHPGRADFICLLCLRNPDDAPTTVACLADAVDDAYPGEALFEPCVTIPADDAQAEGAASLGRNDWTEGHLEAVPILTHTAAGLSMRIDPAYMVAWPSEDDVRDDIAAFCAALDANLRNVLLSPGDILILDNRRAVHGRRPFRARYDGKDRWLKRVNVAEDFTSRLAYCTDPARRLLS